MLLRFRTSTGGAIAWIVGTGLVAFFGYIARETDYGCDSGYVIASTTTCTESGGLWLARIAGTASGLSLVIFIFTSGQAWFQHQRMVRLLHKDPVRAYTEIAAHSNDRWKAEAARNRLLELRAEAEGKTVGQLLGRPGATRGATQVSTIRPAGTSSIDPSNAKPGLTRWFLDPFDESYMRKWDGEVWTRSINDGATVSIGRELTEDERTASFEQIDDFDAHEDSALLATTPAEGESTATQEQLENPSQVVEDDDLDTDDESFDDTAERSPSRTVLSELKLLNEMFQSGEISQSSYLAIQGRLLELLDEQEDD